MNRALRNTIIIGIITVAFSVVIMALSTILIPKTEFDACYNKCIHTDLAQNKISCVVICGQKFSK